ncbi:MAG: wax ester/triacylglycerol synthase family O-acyltransferase, partial [Gordonia sp. (in: high G+C Gram-positive bacteria)]
MSPTTDTTATDDLTSVTLAPPDHTYLHMDTARRPMHWAMVLEIAEDARRLDIDEVRERVRERAARYDIFRMGIANGRWRAPRVVVTETVDADRQVSADEYSDRTDLHVRIAKELETPLRRADPFWHITLYTPRNTGRQVVVLRVHHSISDGIAGAAFAALLADGSAEDLAEFDRFAASPRFHIADVDPAELATAKEAFKGQWEAAKDVRGWPALSRSGRREVAFYSISTRDVRRIARSHQASVHELLVAAIGSAVSTTPPAQRSAGAKLARVTLPVTLDAQFRHTGNAVSVSLLNLALDQPDLAAQIQRSQAELGLIEKQRPELALAATDTAPRLPWPLQRAVVNASMAHMSPDVHIGINPGFTRIRSILGAQIEYLTPLSPLAGYSFSVTALVLGTRTTFGVVADATTLAGYADTFVAAFDKV